MVYQKACKKCGRIISGKCEKTLIYNLVTHEKACNYKLGKVNKNDRKN